MADNDMVAWLEAALTAIEYAANEARRGSGETWAVDGHEVLGTETGHRVVADAYGNAGMSDSDMTHIALHDPRAVLARVAAERTVLALHDPAGTGMCPACTEDDPLLAAGDTGAATAPCPTLRHFAYGHRFDAPGYRDEWTPNV